MIRFPSSGVVAGIFRFRFDVAMCVVLSKLKRVRQAPLSSNAALDLKVRVRSGRGD
jgi:hypothetical protein